AGGGPGCGGGASCRWPGAAIPWSCAPGTSSPRSPPCGGQPRGSGGRNESMCSRFSLRAGGDDLARLFDLADVPDLPARYNVAPAQPVPVVRQDDGGTRTLALLRWGLVPSWARQPGKVGDLINAQSGTAD